MIQITKIVKNFSTFSIFYLGFISSEFFLITYIYEEIAELILWFLYVQIIILVDNCTYRKYTLVVNKTKRKESAIFRL